LKFGRVNSSALELLLLQFAKLGLQVEAFAFLASVKDVQEPLRIGRRQNWVACLDGQLGVAAETVEMRHTLFVLVLLSIACKLLLFLFLAVFWETHLYQLLLKSSITN